MGLIGRNYKHSNVCRRPVLIHRTNTTTTNTTQTKHVCAAASTYPVSDTPQHTKHVYPCQHPDPVPVVNSGGETPGPIPNPEAKPANADGTAPGRVWESRKPPTNNNTNPKHPRTRHHTSNPRVLYHIDTLYPPPATDSGETNTAQSTDYQEQPHTQHPAH